MRIEDTASPASFLHPAEIVVFVDDDKGRFFGRDDNTVGMFARSFERFDRYSRLLVAHLIRHQAWDWHSSEMNGFAQAADFRGILKTINRCQSRAFVVRRTEQQIDEPQFVKAALGGIPAGVLEDWAEYWPIETNRQARLLKFTIQSTVSALARSHRSLPRPSSITFFTDRMSFVSPRAAARQELAYLPGTFLALEATAWEIPVRVVSLLDKPRAPKWVRSFIGLVDGECWLHGRFLRERPLSGGMSIDEKGIAMRASGDPETFDFDISENVAHIRQVASLGGGFAKLSRRLGIYDRMFRTWLIADRWAYNGLYVSEHLKSKKTPTLQSWAI